MRRERGHPVRHMHGGLCAQKPLISARDSPSLSSVCSATKWTKWDLVAVAVGPSREAMETWRVMEQPERRSSPVGLRHSSSMVG